MAIVAQYSPLCDTDIRAYLAYLATCCQDGGVVGQPLSVDGEVDGGKGCSGCGCNRDVFARVVGSVFVSGRALADGHGGGAGFDWVSGDCGGCVSDGSVASEVCVGRVSADSVGVGDSGSGRGSVGIPVDGCAVESPGHGGCPGQASSQSMDTNAVGSHRGKNYARNRASRLRRRRVKDNERAKSNIRRFDDCDQGVQRDLRDTYAARLIAENKAAEARASAYVARSALVKSSRVYETKFELGRQTLEDKLQKISDKRNGVVGVGGSRSGCALGTPATPSMTSGSVSPDSSVSMAEWHSMKKSYDNVVMELNSVKDEVNRMKKVDCVSKVQGEKEMTADILAGRATFLDSREDSVFRRDDVASYGDF